MDTQPSPEETAYSPGNPKHKTNEATTRGLKALRELQTE